MSFERARALLKTQQFRVIFWAGRGILGKYLVFGQKFDFVGKELEIEHSA
jgi:hypothetical protein